MKPSERFAKKVWRKPPKNKSKGHKMPNKSGKGKCAICKLPMTSSKSKLARRNFSPAKSSTRANRPYGGYICTKCLKVQVIEQTRAIAASEN
jgi:large subunit ribosomal protein L34e